MHCSNLYGGRTVRKGRWPGSNCCYIVVEQNMKIVFAENPLEVCHLDLIGITADVVC